MPLLAPRARLPWEYISSCLPCPNSVHNKMYGLKHLPRKYQDYDPQQCFDTRESIHELPLLSSTQWLMWQVLASSGMVVSNPLHPPLLLLELLKFTLITLMLSRYKTYSQMRVKGNGCFSKGYKGNGCFPTLEDVFGKWNLQCIQYEKIIQSSSFTHCNKQDSRCNRDQQTSVEATSPRARMQTESESHILERAVCSTVTSLHDKIQEFPKEEERVDSQTLISNEANALLNITWPMRPTPSYYT